LAVEKVLIFPGPLDVLWGVPSLLSNGVQGRISCRNYTHPAFQLISYSAYYSNLKVEANCSSETSVGFRRATRRCIPEDNDVYHYDVIRTLDEFQHNFWYSYARRKLRPFFILSVVRLSLLYCGHYWPIVPAPDDR
jgi:hypothetical protein